MSTFILEIKNFLVSGMIRNKIFGKRFAIDVNDSLNESFNSQEIVLDLTGQAASSLTLTNIKFIVLSSDSPVTIAITKNANTVTLDSQTCFISSSLVGQIVISNASNTEKAKLKIMIIK
jgi:hypothetical protein